ncbi:hypothetical protein FGRMN_6120 [Fusarium graminum]|nr:hypothetical protein FGRMN_6120 [Fusarium graminum]
MAAPGFGFSVGDFIGAAKLVADVCQALKDTGGAAEDYIEVVTDLNLLNDVLTQLQQSHGDATCESALAEFLDLISKFNDKLGPNRPSSWYRGVGRKSQPVTGIEAPRVGIDGIKIQNDEVITQLRKRPTAVTNDMQTRLDEIKTHNDQTLELFVDLNLQMWKFNGPSNLIASPGSGTNSNINRPVPAPSIINLSNELRDESGIHEPFAPSRITSPGPISRIDSAVHAAGQPEEDTGQVLLLRLIRVIARDLEDLLIKAWLLFPHLMVYYRYICATITTPPMLMATESINFEDVLGHQVTLQYTFFRQWSNFNIFLRHQFQNCPGEDYIARKEGVLPDRCPRPRRRCGFRRGTRREEFGFTWLQNLHVYQIAGIDWRNGRYGSRLPKTRL